MKTLQKVLLILFVAVCIFSTISQTTVFAAGTAVDALNHYVKQNNNSMQTTELATVIGTLLGFLQVASALVAVLMIALTGFNYIVGTPEVKDEMKKKMLPIIIGLILVFGAVSIARFILGAVGQ